MADMENAPPISSTTAAGDGLPRRGWLVGLSLAALGATALAGCDRGGTSWFTLIAEARRLAADLRVQFSRAADASDRAVMADTDEASIAFSVEAEDAKKAVVADSGALLPVLTAVGSATELRLLEEFERAFSEYQTLDRSVLALAVANSNLKAQKLSFGPGRESAEAFRAALEAFERACPLPTLCRAEPSVYSAVVAVKDILILEFPHIAETDDLVMTRIEKEMDRLLASARAALQELSPLASAPARESLSAANSALSSFEETRAKIIALSRENTNVRSLAMSLGPKRPLITACDGELAALQNELAREGLKATR